RVSHAAGADVLPVLSVIINGIHLFAKEAWLGVSIIVSVVYFPKWLSSGDARPSLVGLSRMNRLLSWTFVIVSATGAYIVWLHLKSWGNLRMTDWGAGFISLLIGSAILVGLRLLTHYETHRLTAVRMIILGRLLSLELWAGAGVLLLSSELIITTPPLQEAARTSGFSLALMVLGAGAVATGLILAWFARKDE